MSGRLVGEVLDAREAGYLPGLSDVQLLALVAIAEKCHEHTRQGSVRLPRLAAVMDRSERSAKRAVRALKDRGLIRVVKAGYMSHGSGHANVYQLTMQGPSRAAHAPDDAGATLDGPGTGHVQGTNSDVQGTNRACAGDTLDVTHDGIHDGLNDGTTKERRAHGTRLPDGWQPPPDVVAQMRSDHPHVDLDAQLDAFRDYWQDQPGAKGRKVNWVGTYRNWIRREAKNRPHTNGTRPSRSTVDTKVDGWLNMPIRGAEPKELLP